MNKFLSLIIANIFCIFIFTGSACSKENMNNQSTVIDTTTQTNDSIVVSAKHYLALGDSYTIGQSVDPSMNFPSQAVAVLNTMGIKLGSPQIIATTGWTTIDLQNAIALQQPKGPYDVVTLLIGVNDQYQHLDTVGYKTRFTQLLHESIAFAGNDTARVFVLSIPDYSVTPYAQDYDTATIRQQLLQFNALNKAITLANNVTYIDITPLTEAMKNNTSLTANDGLHPSALEYTQWVNLLAPAMAEVLK
jgi:lysophospholipase L1-like esterase